MRILTIKQPLKTRSQAVYLAPLSDMHIGDHSCDTVWLKRWTGLLRDAHNRGAAVIAPFLGDNGEMISKNDKRHCGSTRHNEIGKQVDEIAEVVRSVWGFCPLVMFGNHEHAVARKGDVDPHDLLCTALGVEEGKLWCAGDAPVDGTMAVLINLTTNHGESRRSRKVFLHHGYFGGSIANRVRRLTGLVRYWDADLVLVGHGHAGVDTGPIGKPRPNQQWTDVNMQEARGVMAATWKRPWVADLTHDESCSYEELRGFEASTHGPTLIKITPKSTQVFFGHSAEEEIHNAR